MYTGQPGESPFGDDASGFSDFFRTLFGQAANGGFGDADDVFGRTRTRTRSRARPGEDVEGEVEVTLPEAYKGTEQVIQISRENGGTPRRLTVKIPPGVKDGQRIRLAGQWNPGVGGGPSGDRGVHRGLLQQPAAALLAGGTCPRRSTNGKTVNPLSTFRGELHCPLAREISSAE